MTGLGIVAILASAALGMALWRSRAAVLYLYEQGAPELMSAGPWRLMGATAYKGDPPRGLLHGSPPVDPFPARVVPARGDTLERYHVRHAWLGITFDHYTFRRPDHSGTEWFRGRTAYVAVLAGLASVPLAAWLLAVAILGGRRRGTAP
jgi:hypothetical protein